MYTVNKTIRKIVYKNYKLKKILLKQKLIKFFTNWFVFFLYTSLRFFLFLSLSVCFLYKENYTWAYFRCSFLFIGHLNQLFRNIFSLYRHNLLLCLEPVNAIAIMQNE